MTKWKHGDHPLQPPPQFSAKPGLNFDAPDHADELFFFEQFFTEELLQHLTDETNSYADEFFQENNDKLGPSSDFKRWAEDGVTPAKMRAFLALTFNFGIVKKDLLKNYWSTDDVLLTPFPRTVMSRVEFYNIMSFLHCCNNLDYVPKGQPGYDPKRKFGKLLPILQEKFQTFWTPRQHISIDEGTIPFKGHVHFKVYNPNKPDKYGIKTFKLCDSSNGYCSNFDIYVGETNNVVSKYGKTYDLVMKLLENYKKQGYIVFMDNFYTSPYLFYNLRVHENTTACGTSRPRKGLPREIVKAKFKERNELITMTYSDQLVAMRILDRKHVTLISSHYGCKQVDTGKKHCQTKEVVNKPEIIHFYNQYMGGVDNNDQLMQYSAFSRQTLKWLKKVLFRLLNLAMVNAYILYCEWLSSVKQYSSAKLKRYSQTEFRSQVIKQMIAKCGNDLSPPCQHKRTPVYNLKLQRLSGRHFIQKIVVEGKSRIMRSCKVCVHAERLEDKAKGNPKRKRPGHETSYECRECGVSLCVDPCFYIYHNYKDYCAKYLLQRK